MSDKLGIRLFSEEPNTSHFLQALDQYNRKFHTSYKKACNSYRESWDGHFGRELQAFGLVQFLAVLGGDAAVNHPGMWFTWADPFDIINAFHKLPKWREAQAAGRGAGRER